MKPILIPLLMATLCVSGAATARFSYDLSGTRWSCDSQEKNSLKGYGSSHGGHAGMPLDFSGDGTWTFVHPDWGTFTGSWTPRGASGFSAFLDGGSLASLESWMERGVELNTDLLAVDITALKTKVRGRVMPAGLLLVKFSATGTGTALAGGRIRRGWARIRSVMAGEPVP